MTNISRQVRRADRPLQNAVPVCLGPRAMARVEVGRRVFGFSHTDRRRQNIVHRLHQAHARDRAGCLEIRHLPCCVNARVRPPGRVECDGSASNLCNPRFEYLLDGLQVRLPLPSVEAGAIVRDGQANVSHAHTDYGHWQPRRNPSAVYALVTWPSTSRDFVQNGVLGGLHNSRTSYKRQKLRRLKNSA